MQECENTCLNFTKAPLKAERDKFVKASIIIMKLLDILRQDNTSYLRDTLQCGFFTWFDFEHSKLIFFGLDRRHLRIDF